MKLKEDQQADALYRTLSEAPANRSKEVSPGIVVDYDDQVGNVILTAGLNGKQFVASGYRRTTNFSTRSATR